MVDFQTIKSVAFGLGPFVLPYLLSSFRKVRNDARAAGPPVPVPSDMRNALNILFAAIAVLLVTSLPFRSPENIFVATSSRLQTPTNVLFERLAAIRPGRTLTEIDELLRGRLATADARSLYLKFGPDALANCLFCNSDNPRSYLFYAIPAILFPHVWNLLFLGIVTSTAVSGREGNRWRLQVALAGGFLALADLYLVNSYDWTANSRVHRAQDLGHFYWNMRMGRALSLAVLDAGIAGLLWAASTRRLFAMPINAAEKVQGLARLMGTTQGKLSASANIRNATFRSPGLRKKVELYWQKEGEVMSEVMAEAEVVESVKNALTSRVSMTRLQNDATSYVESLIQIQSAS